jgi:hypothetical protein
MKKQLDGGWLASPAHQERLGGELTVRLAAGKEDRDEKGNEVLRPAP